MASRLFSWLLMPLWLAILVMVAVIVLAGEAWRGRRRVRGYQGMALTALCALMMVATSLAQTRQFYYLGGQAVRVRDGGTDAHDAPGARQHLDVPGRDANETITGNWKFTGSVSLFGAYVDVYDATFRVHDDVDTTKIGQFQLSGLTTGTTRTWTMPNLSTTIAGLGVLQQTWTGRQMIQPSADSVGFTLRPNAGGIADLFQQYAPTGERNWIVGGGGGTIYGTGNLNISEDFDLSNFALGGSYVGIAAASLTTNRTFTLPNLTGTAAVLTGAQTFDSKTFSTTGNTLRSSTASSGVGFVDNTTTTKQLRVVLSGATGNNSFTINSSSARDYSFPDLGGTMALTTGAQTFDSKTLSTTSNTLRASTATSGVAFEDDATSSKKLRVVLSGATGNNSLTISGAAANDYATMPLGGRLPLVGSAATTPASGLLAKVDTTGRSAAIASTKLTNAPPFGFYAVDVIAMTTTAAGTATLTVTILWTDNVGATTANVISAMPFQTLGRTSGRVILRVASGDINFQTTVAGTQGLARYALYIRVTYLGGA